MAFCDSPLLMVSELCPDGNMQTYLSKQNWAPALGASLLAGVAQGMAHLHSHDIIHGDLKCANVLVGRGGTARISDFGLAKLRRTVAAGTGNGAGPGGTPAFMAPELLSGGEPEKPSDVYAYAMLCYEVVTKGMMPFFGHRMPGLDSILAKMALAMDKEKVLRGERPKDHLDAAEEGLLVEIMDKCWQQDPRERPRFVDVAKIMEDVAVEARLMADGATASFSELSRSYSGAGGEDGGSMAPANNVTK
ncbi:kinase-like domain-containing protein [Hyaloraphidium curvatum]|nr:kinase-like domain-containing protein [Hyaloraphidium curvatum]